MSFKKNVDTIPCIPIPLNIELSKAAVQKAADLILTQESVTPVDYTSKYQSNIDHTADKSFNYDMNTADALYQLYKNQFNEQGLKAMRNTLENSDYQTETGNLQDKLNKEERFSEADYAKFRDTVKG